MESPLPSRVLGILLAGLVLVAPASVRASGSRGCTDIERNSRCGGKQVCNSVNCQVPCLAGMWPSCSEPGLEMCTVLSPYPAGDPCTNDNNPCTTDACDGAGTCVHTNPTGGKVCGAACIAATMCCTNTDCPADPANHRVGVCATTGCAYDCASGYKACAGTCIPTAQCCGASDCSSPINGCYKAAGTCVSGICSYGLNDGAACNADTDACTPNDKCQGGTCIADTAHQVVCLQKECRSAPVCNKTSGNCDDTEVAGACGGNGCTPAGTCAAGTCSTGAMTKICTQLDGVCKVGQCNIATGDCAAVNKQNGVTCAVADKCVLLPTCSGGECVGSRKPCSSSGACRVAECNGSTGECEETVASIGTSCTNSASCTQNAACDATGNCSGNPVADGSPCDSPGCTSAAVCTAGQCVCLQNIDFGITQMENTDMAAAVPIEVGGGGCSIATRAERPSGASMAVFAGLGLLLALRPRRNRRSRSSS